MVPLLNWLPVLLAGLAYAAIAAALARLARQHGNRRRGRHLAVFACLMLVGSFGQVIAAIAIWHQDNNLNTAMELLLSIVPLAAAIVLWRLLPALPGSAAQDDLRQANRRLQAQQTQAAALNRSLELTEQIARVGHWRIELPEHSLFWSDEVYRIHGLERTGLGPTLDEALNAYLPGDRERVAACISQAVQTAEGYEFTARLSRPDGEIRHVLSRGVVETSPDGGVAAIFGVFLDLTEQKLIECKLRMLNIEAEATNRVLAEQASHDCLTGLANRRHFDIALDREFRRACRTGAPLALIMLDVDQFKSYNDQYGHLAGDACLRAIAQVIEANASRAGDLAARFGGEEFAVLMADTEAASAAHVAAAILAGIRAMELPHNGRTEGRVTISAGVAARRVAPGHAATHLFEAADQALYQAKRSGRAIVCIDPGTADAMVVAPDADLEFAGHGRRAR